MLSPSWSPDRGYLYRVGIHNAYMDGVTSRWYWLIHFVITPNSWQPAANQINRVKRTLGLCGVQSHMKDIQLGIASPSWSLGRVWMIRDRVGPFRHVRN